MDIGGQFQRFLAANEVAVGFLHGQVFFVLGLALGMQWRQRSRLELARALPWLAAFGLCEAFAIWGGIFLPLQAAYLDASATLTLRAVEVLLRLVAAATLLGFGLRLNEPTVPPPLTLAAPAAVAAVGAVALALLRLSGAADFVASEAVVRYAIGAPSALLVAYGLRSQAIRLVGSPKVPRFIGALRVAGFGFAFFAFSDGILAPASPVLWGSFLNESLPLSVVGVPLTAIRTAIGAVIAVFFFVALDVFRLESDRLAQALAQQQALGAERERISRELHDGTIQSIYAFGLVLDDAQHALGRGREAVDGERARLLEHADRQLSYAVGGLNQTIGDIRRFIYDLRETRADEDLARGLLEIIAEFRMRTGLSVGWHVSGHPGAPVPPSQRHHIYQIAREALSNAARHAGAEAIDVRLDYANAVEARGLRMVISDNGIGVSTTGGQPGRGLRNMRERARIMGGALSVEGLAGKGTTVTLDI